MIVLLELAWGRKGEDSCTPAAWEAFSDFQRAQAKDESRDKTKDDERRAPTWNRLRKFEASEAHPWKQKRLELRKEAQKETDRPAAWSRKNSEQFPFCFVSIFPILRLDSGKKKSMLAESNQGSKQTSAFLSPQGGVSEAPWENLPKVQKADRWYKDHFHASYIIMETVREGPTVLFQEGREEVRLTTGQSALH